MEAVAVDVDAICAAVAADVGESPDVVRADVELALRLLATPEQERPVVDKATKQLSRRGAEAAVEGLPTERLIDRYMSALPAIWDAARDMSPTPDALNEVGSWLLRAADIAAMAIAEGYTKADREIVARDATARRAFLEELLSSVVHDDPTFARLRRLAVRYGLNPGRFVPGGRDLAPPRRSRRRGARPCRPPCVANGRGLVDRPVAGRRDPAAAGAGPAAPDRGPGASRLARIRSPQDRVGQADAGLDGRHGSASRGGRGAVAVACPVGRHAASGGPNGARRVGRER